MWASAQVKLKLMGEEDILVTDQQTQETLKEDAENDTVQRFFVIGDFGDMATYTDLDHVTDMMQKISSSQKFDFIATVGDNVYEKGIKSMDKLDEVNQIMKAFKKPTLQDIPMYLTLGNHDCYSDYKNEIEYSKYDKQWNMESDYYELKYEMKDDPSKSMVLLMTNSCLLACLSDIQSEENKDLDCDAMNVKIGGKKVRAHYDWLEDKLRKYSNNPDVAWLGVVMHHPILIEPTMKQDLLPMLQRYKVDMAIVGHKHMFEYANIGYSDQIRFPGKANGPLIEDCKEKKEIINTPTRTQVFKKGETLHQFMVGGSGREFKDICPYYDQDGKVLFQSIKEHGMVTIEVDSKHFTAKYLQGPQQVEYEVTIMS